MPRANRYFVPGKIFHITHRCHKQEFLLKFLRDRKRYCYWLFEAKKRYGLSILNYMVTSNHVHLLVYESSNGAIKSSMQLIAARIAQEYKSSRRSSHKLRPLTPPYKRCRIRRFRLSFYQFEPMLA